eukprot:946767-Amphidinium_carterae.2
MRTIVWRFHYNCLTAPSGQDGAPKPIAELRNAVKHYTLHQGRNASTHGGEDPPCHVILDSR